jgi:hypothetical protein
MIELSELKEILLIGGLFQLIASLAVALPGADNRQ